jgi:phospholipid/cholesterol/gamma-HCH transport system substrate-binding protein
MESDKHYFLEGLFIIGVAVAAAFFSVWLVSTGHRDDVIYRIHFAESVSGLSPGDAVKFHGVDVGTVRSMTIDAQDPQKVQVDVRLRKETPVTTDTKASLRLKGITGVIFVELNGGSAGATRLVAATPEGQIPEIPSEKSSLTAIFEELPKVLQRLSALEAQGKKVMTDVGEVTEKVKDNPLLKLGSKKKESDGDR